MTLGERAAGRGVGGWTFLQMDSASPRVELGNKLLLSRSLAEGVRWVLRRPKGIVKRDCDPVAGGIEMTDAGCKVLAGFVRLSDSDQTAVVEAMNRFVAATPPERVNLRQEFGKAVMGPVDSGCPCCGR